MNNIKFLCVVILLSHNIRSQNLVSNYYVLNVIIDERIEKSKSIGNIYTANLKEKTSFELEGGTIQYLNKKLNPTFVKTKISNAYAVNLLLKVLQVSEFVGKDNLITGQLNFEGNYYLNSLKDSTQILPFKFRVVYKRTPKQFGQIMSLVNTKTIELSKKLEGWFKNEYGSNTVLLRKTKVNVKNYIPQKEEYDTLFYDQRKLELTDFVMLEPDNGHRNSAITSKFKYTLEPNIKGDTYWINAKVKVFQVRSQSWVSKNGSLDKKLEFNQLQFDITQMHAEKFIDEISKLELSYQNYDELIGNVYLKIFDNLAEIQNNITFRNMGGWDISHQITYAKGIISELKNGKFGQYEQK